LNSSDESFISVIAGPNIITVCHQVGPFRTWQGRGLNNLIPIIETDIFVIGVG